MDSIFGHSVEKMNSEIELNSHKSHFLNVNGYLIYDIEEKVEWEQRNKFHVILSHSLDDETNKWKLENHCFKSYMVYFRVLPCIKIMIIMTRKRASTMKMPCKTHCMTIRVFTLKMTDTTRELMKRTLDNSLRNLAI